MKMDSMKLRACALQVSAVFALVGCVATLPNNIAEKSPVDPKPAAQDSKAVASNAATPSASAQLKQTPDAQASAKLTPMPLLIKDGDYDKARFCTASDSVIKRVDSKGTVTLKSGKTLRLKAFKGDVIESVRYIADESHITFAYGLSSGGDGDAYLCKYQLSNLKQLWCTQLVTIYEGYYSNSGLIYTVGYDMISKIDQNTGKQLWTVPSLTSSNQFESSYTKPFEDANNITFVSTIGSGATVRRFVFNNQNGKMLSKQVLPAKTFLADASQQAEGKCPK